MVLFVAYAYKKQSVMFAVVCACKKLFIVLIDSVDCCLGMQEATRSVSCCLSMQEAAKGRAAPSAGQRSTSTKNCACFYGNVHKTLQRKYD
eukprot:1159258-Pelagomonas_calceolata.AAC.10